jgi:hypothetical protein
VRSSQRKTLAMARPTRKVRRGTRAVGRGRTLKTIPAAAPSGTASVSAWRARVHADDLEAKRVPSVRIIRARLHIGQPRAQRVQAYLATITNR